MWRFWACFLSIFNTLPLLAATFGTVTPHTAPLGDIVLDETRSRLYVLNTTASPPLVEIYTTTTNPASPALGAPRIAVDSEPLAMAMSPDAKYLYVACYGASAVDVIDLTKMTNSGTISLSSNPEAVAVGYDGKVLISTIGGTGKAVLAIYNPNAASTANPLTAVAVAPTAPTTPTFPAPSNMEPLAGAARLVATPDGRTIVGVHKSSTTVRTVFVYDVASATVLRSRTLTTTSASNVLAVSADGSKLLSGAVLFDTGTLAVLAQQSTINSPFTFVSTANFITQTNEGGAVFSPDGTKLYTAYNILPNLSPAPQSNYSQLLVNTPGSLLITMGLMLPENLSGKMAISSDGGTIWAVSQSGFIKLPLNTLTSTAPVAVPSSNVALVVHDQCGVYSAQNSTTIAVTNGGGGSRMTITAALLATASTSATIKASSTTGGGSVVATFNSTNNNTPGTVAPDQILIQSQEAVNIIPNVRVYQNNRNSEAAGTLVPIDIGASTTGLTDLLADPGRHLLYIANPGLNRIEVYDTQAKQLLTPISVGQLPKSMAFGDDTNTLYVANSGGETLSVVNLNTQTVTGLVYPPPFSFNSTAAVVTPTVVASSQQGPQVLLANTTTSGAASTTGTLWYISGNNLVPRTLNPLIFGATTTLTLPVSMVSTGDNSSVFVLGGSGTGYLYSAAADNFVETQTVVTSLLGYFGAVAAGPAGQYYVAGPNLLNSSLTLIDSTATGTTTTTPTPIGPGFPGPIGPTSSSTSRPVAAVAAATATSFLRFSMPVRASATAAPSDAGLIELVDTASFSATASANALEGPLATVLSTQRTNIGGRTMALDSTSNTVYVLTATGLSVIPLAGAARSSTPSVSPSGVVNSANFRTGIAPGGLVSIMGQNLAASASAGSTPLPTMLGGSCVTLSNTPLPLLATAPGQINAQIPFTLAAGAYTLVVRSTANQAASSSVSVTVSKYAPAIFVDSTGPAIYHVNSGQQVDQAHPATRDEPLVIYATGLGATTGGKVTAGSPSPSSPLAVTAAVALYFGNPLISNTAVIVNWSGLQAGTMGIYQINCTIPGNHYNGNALPVTLRIGGVSTPTTGANVAVVYVD
ncbi:MAG: hypothetical protein ACLQVN_15900 [Bryobacteraceae bacterium]